MLFYLEIPTEDLEEFWGGKCSLNQQLIYGKFYRWNKKDDTRAISPHIFVYILFHTVFHTFNRDISSTLRSVGIDLPLIIIFGARLLHWYIHMFKDKCTCLSAANLLGLCPIGY